MFIKKIRPILSTLIVVAASLGVLSVARPVYAAVAPGCYDKFAGDQLYHLVTCPDVNKSDVLAGSCFTRNIQPKSTPPYAKVDCATIDPGQLSSDTPSNSNNYAGTPVDDNGQAIYNWLERGINFLSALVGIAVVGSIVLGGIQYTTAGADPQKVSGAKNRIFNALIALFAYLFIYAFLQWLVPGGLF